jgi:hypothetical protein
MQLDIHCSCICCVVCCMWLWHQLMNNRCILFLDLGRIEIPFVSVHQSSLPCSGMATMICSVNFLEKNSSKVAWWGSFYQSMFNVACHFVKLFLMSSWVSISTDNVGQECQVSEICRERHKIARPSARGKGGPAAAAAMDHDACRMEIWSLD